MATYDINMELTDIIVTEEIVAEQKKDAGQRAEFYIPDARTGTWHIVPKKFHPTPDWYEKYRMLLNETATNGGMLVRVDQVSMAQRLLGAGFIPLVAMPSFCITNEFHTKVRDILMQENIPYLDIYPIRFAQNKWQFVTNIKDLWIHRVDAAARLKVSNLNMATVSAIWKELNLNACFA